MSFQSVNMAAQDEVDVCESWEDMDEIGVSVTVEVEPGRFPRRYWRPWYYLQVRLFISVGPED